MRTLIINLIQKYKAVYPNVWNLYEGDADALIEMIEKRLNNGEQPISVLKSINKSFDNNNY